MTEPDRKIIELEARLDSLMRTQIDFQVEVTAIRNELSRLRTESVGIPETNIPERPRSVPQPTLEPAYVPPSATPPPRPTSESVPPPSFGYAPRNDHPSPSSEFDDKVSNFFAKYTESARQDLEKFIGENLISKIGILILIIGIGIGVKYSIDNNLISPLTRVIFGYAFGFGLVGLAIKLKAKYLNFSSVLISGGMATMYFVTYFAYSLYGLIPQVTSFGLMAMFTFLTVGAALAYNRQVIAHIGLVGAYAVPFLLSNNSGNYLFLFVYMTFINLGILAIAIKREWKSLFYTSFVFTWLIFAGWFFNRYTSEHFGLALTFLAVFTAIFLATKLLHAARREGSEKIEDIVGALAIIFVFYSFTLGVSSDRLSGPQVSILFAYLAVAAILILLASFRYFGRLVVFLTFAAVWTIYAEWFLVRYDPESQILIAATFAGVFFAVIYVTTLAYRLLRESFSAFEYTGAILTNSFLFYGFGYSILDGNEATRHLLGLYTVSQSALHLAVAGLVNRIRPSAVDVVQVLTILILTFASIAIPVQFDGNFVTMMWGVEAALLFWLGRSRGVRIFEFLSYPVMALAGLSLIADWTFAFGQALQPLANGNFITALVIVTVFAFIFLVNRDEDSEPAIPVELVRQLGYVFAAVALFVFYNTFRIEIGNYFDLKIAALGSDYVQSFTSQYGDLRKLNAIWQVNYTLFFLALLGLVNQLKLRSRGLALVNGVLGIVVLFIFSTLVMYLFSELRESFQRANGENLGSINIAIRYISYPFAGGMLWTLYRSVRDDILDSWIDPNSFLLIFESVFYLFVFVVGSCELVNVMGQLYISDATRYGLTIFWGIYALALIVLGIWWDKKHLRVAAMVLIGITLAKLFFFDISELGTIPKTILFVTLGMTLLVIAFLYSKFKNTMFPPPVEPTPEPVEGSVADIT